MVWQKENGAICFNDSEQIVKELGELLKELEPPSKEEIDKMVERLLEKEN